MGRREEPDWLQFDHLWQCKELGELTIGERDFEDGRKGKSVLWEDCGLCVVFSPNGPQGFHMGQFNNVTEITIDRFAYKNNKPFGRLMMGYTGLGKPRFCCGEFDLDRDGLIWSVYWDSVFDKNDPNMYHNAAGLGGRIAAYKTYPLKHFEGEVFGDAYDLLGTQGEKRLGIYVPDWGQLGIESPDWGWGDDVARGWRFNLKLWENLVTISPQWFTEPRERYQQLMGVMKSIPSRIELIRF